MSSPLDGALRRRGKPIDLRRLDRTTEWRRGIAAEQRRLSRALAGATDPRADCPICGALRAERFVDVFAYPYLACRECGHVFCAAPPREDALAQLYARAGDAGAAQHRVYLDEGLFRERVEQIARPKVTFVAEVIGGEGLWVDLGCGTGELLFAAREAGFETLGFEVDAKEVEFARARGLEVMERLVTAEDGPGDLGGARVVSLVNVLEHVREPLALLRALGLGLAPGAHLVIEVPRHPSLSSFVAQAFPDLAARHIYAPDHLHVFTESSLALALESGGFVARAVWTFGQDFYDLVSTAACNAGLPDGGFHDQVLELSSDLQRAIDARDFSDSMLVVAEKRAGGEA